MPGNLIKVLNLLYNFHLSNIFNLFRQYELHKERQTELERLAWLLRQDENVNSLTTELEVTRELSLVHYLLTHMNLKRMKELEEEEEAIKSNNADLVQEMLEKTTI